MHQMWHSTGFFVQLNVSLITKRAAFVLNAGFAMAVLDLISPVSLATFIVLHKYL